VTATTARPTDRALVVGPVCGLAGCLCGWLATSRGVTFTWEQAKTYWPDNEPFPQARSSADTPLGLLGLVVGVLAA